MVRFPAPYSARSNTGTSPSANSRITAATARMLGLAPSRNMVEPRVLDGNSIFEERCWSICPMQTLGEVNSSRMRLSHLPTEARLLPSSSSVATARDMPLKSYFQSVNDGMNPPPGSLDMFPNLHQKA